MPQNENGSDETNNPILNVAFGFLEAFAPGWRDDPGKAMRELLPKLRFLIVSKVEKPTTAQLTFLRSCHEFENSNLLQVRKALQNGDLEFGPYPVENAARDFLPAFEQAGFTVSLRELTQAEKQAHLS